MDFKDSVQQLCEKIEKVKGNIATEEATKNALIMPFLQILGYDVFNPLEVMPEFVCDIGTKKGEKIDYAVFKNGEPVILVECKHWRQDLTLHDNQLLRYFHVSAAKFGVLTNGVVYKFYTDLDTPNKMDDKPFFEVDLSDVKTGQIEELKKFHKSYFDIAAILTSAEELKHTSTLKGLLRKEFSDPSNDFVKYFVKQIYDGRITDKVTEQLTPLVRKTLNGFVNDLLSDRLKAAIKNSENGGGAPTDTTESIMDEAPAVNDEGKNIVTTDTELQGYYIVKAILMKTTPADRIVFKDAVDYFAINIDHIYKNVCRLYFNNPENLRIAFRAENKREERLQIASVESLYDYADRFIEIAEKYK